MTISRGTQFWKGTAAGRTALIVAITISVWLVVGMVPVARTAAATPTFNAVGSAEQVYVTGLAPSAQASLITSHGQTLSTQKADSLGGLLFRNVQPGSGYRVIRSSNGEESAPLTVHTDAAAPWDPSSYDQTISDNGYQYLTTRDGTKLAIDVHPPTNPAGEPGLPPGTPLPNGPAAYLPPYPTLIEYSGYGYADPAGPENGIAILANLMGFAVVDVNMRGTGCSGGAFNFFEPLQNLDGYDVIQTIAHQSWVLGHKVGMMGISYGAISQLFVSQLDPPALEAISPLSTIDATASTLYPGGTLNTGFAVAWAEQRQQNAEPAGPNSGQAWAYKQIQSGDTTCAANQDLHGEASNLLSEITSNSYYNPAVANPLDPDTFVNKITVPVFMACQWEDEQTGGHCPELVSRFTGTTKKWFTFTNGAHIDSLDPATFDRWYDFLELFVAHRAPVVSSAVIRAAAPVIYQDAMGIPATDPITLPLDPIQAIPTYTAALAAFEKLPGIRVLFDNGSGSSPTGTSAAGDPYPGFEKDFSSFPLPGTVAHTWYLGPNGTLAIHPPTVEGINRYTSNASTLPLTDYGTNTGSGGLWGNASQWQWNWEQYPSGSAVSYVSAPLTTDATVVGGVRLGTFIDPRCRPSSNHQRGPSGRERDIRPERLDSSERAKAVLRFRQRVRYAEHSARSHPKFQEGRRCAHADGTVRRGCNSSVLRGARLPCGIAHSRDDFCAQRYPARVVLRSNGSHWNGDRVHRLLRLDAVEPHRPGRAGCAGAHLSAGVPEPAQRAMQVVPIDCEQWSSSMRLAPCSPWLSRPPRRPKGF